ncbi:MAG: tetratricopeptide repeat protein [Sulfurifustis sp.]
MANPPYIFDVGADSFANLVLKTSVNNPVVVIYWSPKVSASLMLVPRLIRLATQCNGRFAAALLNVDANEPFTREHGIEHVPTIALYRDGQLVDTLIDDDSEPGLRAFIGKHIALRGANRLYAEAVKAYGVGDNARGLQLATEAALMEPDNVRTPIDVVKLLVLAGRFEQAEDLLRAMPDAVRDDPEIRNLTAHLTFIRISMDTPPVGKLESTVTLDPTNLDARYQLAATKVVQNDFEGAMQHLLEIARRNPSFRDNAGRNGLLALFHMLGEDDDRVRRYRPLLLESMN